MSQEIIGDALRLLIMALVGFMAGMNYGSKHAARCPEYQECPMGGRCYTTPGGRP